MNYASQPVSLNFSGENMASNWYLEVQSPTIGALNDKLRQLGLGVTASPIGRFGFEVHCGAGRSITQAIADELIAGGYPTRANYDGPDAVLVGDIYVPPDEAADYAAAEDEALQTLGADDPDGLTGTGGAIWQT